MTNFITHDHIRLAYQHQTGEAPGIFFLGGYFSDMTGTKAEYLAAQCAASGRAYTRFDYRGHGQSEGRFRDACLGDWYSDALAVFDQCTTGTQILVGSSMGGWLALKLALARPERVCGLVGVAAAPDFTEDLVWDLLSPEDQTRMVQEGFLRGSGTDSLVYTHRLVEEGRQHLLLRAPLPLACPVRLLQGQQDDAVPWQTALRIEQRVQEHGGDVAVTFIPDGDHRLSRDADCALLWQTITALLPS